MYCFYQLFLLRSKLMNYQDHDLRTIFHNFISLQQFYVFPITIARDITLRFKCGGNAWCQLFSSLATNKECVWNYYYSYGYSRMQFGKVSFRVEFILGNLIKP